MKEPLLSLFILAFAYVSVAQAQITKTLIGSSYNIYSVISPSTNPVHANNDLGTISFTHRQNSNLSGGSGVIQTSWSTDGGETWEYVLQPTNDSTQYNRYPSGAIVDLTGNGLGSAHTVVAGPTTSSAASGWVSNYFYNFALDGTGGREYNRDEPNNTADQSKLTRVGMMVDKNNVVRILGYFNTNLYITTGEFNPTGTNYSTDFVYASTISYYTGEYLDENGNVTTPAAWGPANHIQLGDTIFYMTSENYDLFSDGSIDSTWTNEIEIISYYDNNGDSLLMPDTLNVWRNVASIQNAEGEWISTTFPYDSFYVELNGAIDSTVVVGVPGYYWTENMITTNGLPDASTNDDTYTIYGYSMAFNQDGNIGYAVMLGDQENGLISPFVHKTIDGGVTWTEQTIDFSDIDGYNQPFFTGEIDCTVDMNGSLHMMCVIEEGQNGTTATTNANIYDVVVNIDNEVTTNWISNLNTAAIAYDSPQALDGEIGWGHRLQASRNENGSKIFALWNDVNTDEFETDLLEYPDIFAIGIDIEDNTTTGVKNFTTYTDYDAMNYWTFTSPITYDEGDTYHLPTTTSENGSTGLDPSEHYYVHGIQFNEDDFSSFNFFTLYGCTDSFACNYNANAINDDGSCEYTEEDGFDCDGNLLEACPYDIYLEYDANALSFNIDLCQTLIVYGCTDTVAENYISVANIDDGSCEYIIGCTDSGADNYNIDATQDDGSCIYYGCMDQEADNYNQQATQDDGNCIYFGCMNNTAENYDLTANEDDGSCIIYGCTVDLYPNFNPVATVDDFSCDMTSTDIYGCTSDEYVEYNPNANIDNGTCLTAILEGCLDSNACNFNPNATDDDGSCLYADLGYDCEGNCINDTDQDGVCDEEDNCIEEGNPDQEDTDNDGEGDVCDYDDGLGIVELTEDTPTLIKMIDVLGRVHRVHKKGSILFYIYDNGKVEKKFNP